METAIVGGGCFWCIEALFQQIKGVEKTTPGYCGGTLKDPSYQQVKTGTTGHVEVLRVVYDPEIIEIFMNIHDPTQMDGQGQDIGSQYLSTIFYQNENQKLICQQIIAKQQEIYETQKKKIATELKEQDIFYEAENYHQNYYNLRGSSNPYCNIIPGKIQKLRALFKSHCTEKKE